MSTVAEIIENPNWYLHNIDLDQGLLLFVNTEPSALSSASFLDARFQPQGSSKTIPIAQALELKRVENSAMYIFHTAFCCSTLLARCLDLQPHTIALKEPQVLMTLANYKRAGHTEMQNPERAKQLVALVHGLLARPFQEKQRVIIKPTNTVNNLIGELLAANDENKCLLLHSDLKSFLISLLKKGEEGRAFGRNLYNIFSMDSPEAQQLNHAQLMRMTDSQIAAIVWHLQFEHFIAAAERFGESRLKSLHCDRLIESPPEILRRAVTHFGLESLADNFDRLVENAPLNSDAKTPGTKFSGTDRVSQHKQAEELLKNTLDVIIPWAKQLRFRYASQEEVALKL